MNLKKAVITMKVIMIHMVKATVVVYWSLAKEAVNTTIKEK